MHSSIHQYVHASIPMFIHSLRTCQGPLRAGNTMKNWAYLIPLLAGDYSFRKLILQIIIIHIKTKLPVAIKKYQEKGQGAIRIRRNCSLKRVMEGSSGEWRLNRDPKKEQHPAGSPWREHSRQINFPGREPGSVSSRSWKMAEIPGAY